MRIDIEFSERVSIESHGHITVIDSGIKRMREMYINSCRFVVSDNNRIFSISMDDHTEIQK